MSTVNSTISAQELPPHGGADIQARASGIFSAMMADISGWQVVLALLLGAVLYDQGKPPSSTARSLNRLGC